MVYLRTSAPPRMTDSGPMALVAIGFPSNSRASTPRHRDWIRYAANGLALTGEHDLRGPRGHELDVALAPDQLIGAGAPVQDVEAEPAVLAGRARARHEDVVASAVTAVERHQDRLVDARVDRDLVPGL